MNAIFHSCGDQMFPENSHSGCQIVTEDVFGTGDLWRYCEAHDMLVRPVGSASTDAEK